MLVKEIIKKVLNYTNNFELFNAVVQDSLNEEQMKEINLLVDCVNLTNSNIATNYVKLYDYKTVKVENSFVEYSDITDKMIYDIVSIKSKNCQVDYQVLSSGVLVNAKEIDVKFSYFPKDVNLEGEIVNYGHKVNERVFVYGVISEYLYVKGVFDEAQLWEEKFKIEMKNCMKTAKSYKYNKRRWI